MARKVPKADESYMDSLNNPRVNKTRGIKYAILEQVMRDNLYDDMNIIELFAGAGINTGFVLENCKPRNLYLADISEECVTELKRKFDHMSNVEIKCTDSFKDYPDMVNCDFLFLDSAFKFSIIERFKNLFDYLSKLDNNAMKICFTESETYKFTFLKKEEVQEKRQEHFNKLIKLFSDMGWYTEKLYFCSSNAYLVLTKIPNGSGGTEFIEYTQGSDKWKKYAYEQKGSDLI